MEKNWYIFHDQPKKGTDFLLCWDKAWWKKEKAESLWIQIFESREEIIQRFPFLSGISVEEKKADSPKKNQPNQMSLF